MIRPAAAVLAGGLLLIWPAFLNGYPILFSDTGAFLSQTLDAFWAFDKPFAYGPFLHAFHWGISLWGPAAAQGVVLSWLVWLVARVIAGRAAPGRHVLLCAGLAALTPAPWVAALLMPDIFAPITVLALVLLGFGWDRLASWERLALPGLATLAIAVHLTHLPIAAALAALTLLLSRRIGPALRVALPLALALAWLVGSNWVGFGRAAVSPYGAVFALARLVADGPGAALLAARCPAAGWTLCGWVGRLPRDADAFLWGRGGPLWSLPDGSGRPGGAMAFAPEAGVIVAETLAAHPGAVLQAALGNAWRQLFLAGIGDVLPATELRDSAELKIGRHFPPEEVSQERTSLQSTDRLLAAAQPWLWPHAAVGWLGAGLALLAWWRAAWAGDRRRLGLVLGVLVGITVNAAATGALSGPHPRYQARVVWLLPLAGLLAARPPRPGRPVAYG